MAFCSVLYITNILSLLSLSHKKRHSYPFLFYNSGQKVFGQKVFLIQLHVYILCIIYTFYIFYIFLDF